MPAARPRHQDEIVAHLVAILQRRFRVVCVVGREPPPDWLRDAERRRLPLHQAARVS